MLHLRKLQLLCCVYVVERDREVVGNWLVAKTTFPPLDVTCPARAWFSAVRSCHTRERREG